MTGNWKGTSKLYLQGADGPFNESPSTLMAVPGVNGRFVEVRYDWADNGKPQQGFALIARDGEVATAAWADSWHQGSRVMFCTGAATPNGVNVKGAYSVPGHPDWYWRLEFDHEHEALRMTMYNVSPEGEEDLAVSAVYQRA